LDSYGSTGALYSAHSTGNTLGDLYAVNGVIYIWSSTGGGSFVAQGSVGVEGSTGATGAAGAAGAAGGPGAPGANGAAGAAGTAGAAGATGATGAAGTNGSDAIPSLQKAPLLFSSKNEASVTTTAVAGKAYEVSFTVQTRAANIADASKLALNAALSATNANSKFAQLVIVPSTGLNSRGQVVQTLQVTGLYLPGSDNEKIKVSLTEAKAKPVSGIVGNMTLTLVNVTQLEKDRILLNEELEAAIDKVDTARVARDAANTALVAANKTLKTAQAALKKSNNAKNKAAVTKALSQVNLWKAKLVTTNADLTKALAAQDAVANKISNS
jgi:hypothetical protein